MNDMIVASDAFTYASIPADIAEEARELAEEFHLFQRRAIDGMAAIGRRLIAVRARLAHGLFLKWVEAELGSKSSAYRCITIAERFEPAILPKLGSLGMGTVHMLASAPSDTRDEIVGRLASGEHLRAADVKGQVAVARHAARFATQQARDAERQRQRRRRRHERDVEKEQQDRDVEEARQKEVVRCAADLIAERLGADLPVLIEMLDDCGVWRLIAALRERRTSASSGDDNVIPLSTREPILAGIGGKEAQR